MAGCSNVADIYQEELTAEIAQETEARIFHARFESVDTKTFVDSDLHLFWTNDDRLSIFEGNTYNQQYKYTGETGKNNADFEKVSSGYHSGSTLDSPASYAVYPYSSTTSIDQGSGAISFSLPSVQQYAEGSFGLEANTMVAVTEDMEDDYLSFKNVGGYIVFKLYGEGAVIKSITLTSREGETLAGNAVITASYSAKPSITFKDDDSIVSSLTIDCGDGVELGATAEESKSFWFVVPPLTFSNGFSVTFTSTDDSSITRTVSGSKTVERNKIYSFPALEMVFESAKTNFLDETLPGVYSCNSEKYIVSNLYQYSAGYDQYSKSSGKFRLQNLKSGHLAGAAVSSDSITEGTSYSVSLMLYGIEGYSDGSYLKTMVAEKVEDGKVWLLEDNGSLGFIIYN